MLSEFLQHQLDYIYFLYGFSFILMASICVHLIKEKTQRLPWIWLGLFGVSHGINEWLDMAALSFWDGTVFTVIRIGLMGLSFIFLMEFGRVGLIKLTGKGPGRWIYIPLLLLAASGGMAGLIGINVTLRYIFGFFGALWAALALLTAAKTANESRLTLLLAACAMALYAIATSFIVPKTFFFPSSLINQSAFFTFTGIPIQLIRGLIAFILSATIGKYYRQIKVFIFPEIKEEAKKYYDVHFNIVLIIVLIFGFLLTNYFDNVVSKHKEKDILSTSIIASLNPVNEKFIAGLQADINTDKNYKLIEKIRLIPIGITLLAALLIIVSIMSHRRLWETAQLASAREIALQESEKKYRSIFESFRDIYFRSDKMGKLVSISPSVFAWSGYKPEDVIGQQTTDFYANPLVWDEIMDKLKESDSLHDFELQLVGENGNIIDFSLNTHVNYDEDGQPAGLEGVLRDITERKLAEKKLLELSLIDELTGLYNRRGFLTLATQQMKIADRLKQVLILIYADLDELKLINDKLGHKEGDMALIDATTILKSSFRASDILARLGGDEFVGLAMESIGVSSETIIARLLENLNAFNMQGAKPYKLSMSIGVAVYDPEKPCSLGELLEQGDNLMYEQKQKKRCS